MDPRDPASRRSSSLFARHLSRRTVLRGSALSLLLGACGVGDSAGVLTQSISSFAERPDALPEAPLSTFPLGVASGDVTAESAIVWANYRGLATLFVAVWDMVDATTGELVAWGPASPAGGGFSQLDVDGLAPGRDHRFAFIEIENGVAVRRSALGRFRTAMDPEASLPLRFAASACTKQGKSMAPLEQAGNRSDLAFFALLGDTSYNDGAATRGDFRTLWAQNLSTNGYRRVRAATSVVATWDDHEIGNDWNPETVNQSVLAEGTAAFFEHLPMRRPAAPGRIWRSLRHGRTAEIFILDGRSERRPSTRSSANAQYLSRAQMDWLKAGLAASPCTFKVIMNSVPITNFPGLYDLVSADRWEGYAAQRTEILSFIENEHIGGVLWVSGDLHLGSTGRVSPSGVGRTAIEVLAGPGAQSASPILWSLSGSSQFDYTTGTNNTTLFDLDPATRKATISFHSGTGAVLATRSYVL